MLVLTLLGLIHVACSNDILPDVYVEKPLPDFDEEDPFVSSQPGQYDTISPLELKRLPRKVDGIWKNHVHGLKMEVPMVQNERNFLNGVAFDEVKNKVQTMSQGLVLQNLEKVGASLSTRNPFLANKNYLGDRILLRSPTSLVDTNVSFKILETRRNWEPNFLRTDIE